MKHRIAHRKLGRTREHRLATLRNLAAALFEHERITTTIDKAKELRPFAERMITRARKDSLHSRRIIARDLRQRPILSKLFDDIAPRFAERPGGYTRIIRAMPRRGDAATMAVIELVSRSGEADASSGSASQGASKSTKKTSKKPTAKRKTASKGSAAAKPSGRKKSPRKKAAKKKSAKKSTKKVSSQKKPSG